MIEFEQLGLNEWVEKIKNLNENFDEIIDQTMDDARQRCETEARKNCPKQTGDLAKSIYSFNITNGFRIGASIDYAVFNEYGSITTPIGTVHEPIPAKYIGFRPFLRPAMYKIREEMNKIFGGKLQEVTNIRVMGEKI